ncbi:hypothetical protein MUN88_15505 [Gracilibacillus caseinilyticus]|uniref:Competence protein ComGG n=1 Tax=Gracilibacillus caseinilyticus TaxID=2932256 RepID=A0ABY4F1Y2_9BACI|nr:hypothetical protein [Gracilibacillus caseinilyticus]UOQ50676.1 hypothetical protein MUN88_15505 [Gracilibacillus caseinilyticus]
MKNIYLKKVCNQQGVMFPLTSIVIVLLLLFTTHLIMLNRNLVALHQIHEQQFTLEMLYQKSYQQLLQETQTPPIHYSFPDGTVIITAEKIENTTIYSFELQSKNGGYRLIKTNLAD